MDEETIRRQEKGKEMKWNERSSSSNSSSKYNKNNK